MSTIILESEDIKTNPFLTGTFGKSLETFEKLRGTKNKRHEELIKSFLKSPCKSIDYLRNLIFKNYSDIFEVGNASINKGDYIVTKLYLEKYKK